VVGAPSRSHVADAIVTKPNAFLQCKVRVRSRTISRHRDYMRALAAMQRRWSWRAEEEKADYKAEQAENADDAEAA
jgi:hypothetical protein